MKLLKKTHLYCAFALMGFLLLGTAAHGFIAFEHTHPEQRNLLIRKIDKQQWTIGYRYSAECLPGDRQNGKALEEAITTALRAWLQPLRELQPARPITDDFRYVLQPDFNGDRFGDRPGLIAVDTRITFECQKEQSRIWWNVVDPPDIYMRKGTKITPSLISALTHELGHAFGLADTYLAAYRPRDGFVSTGGLERTVGTQPPSLMAALTAAITEDDRNGMLWFYKRFHENLDLEDCFFPDYMFEASPRGCIPKYPLIFEVKHGHAKNVERILDEDPKLDVNAQDDGGLTALHHAVIQEAYEVADHLLSQRRIKPFLRDKQGRSTLAIARESKLKDIITLLLEHPLTLPVRPKDKLATTWGHLKQRD